jgi:hypothetical protein
VRLWVLISGTAKREWRAPLPRETTQRRVLLTLGVTLDEGRGHVTLHAPITALGKILARTGAAGDREVGGTLGKLVGGGGGEHYIHT